jgi:hypothetical protein
MPDSITVGGGGADGAVTVLDASGQPILDARIRPRGFNIKANELRLGAPGSTGVLRMIDTEGDSTATLDGFNGSLSLGGRPTVGAKGSNGSISLFDRDGNNTVQINSGTDGADLFLGAANRPARIQLTTGGNPGPTIELNGSKNSLLFLKKGSNTDAIVQVDGTGKIRAGGFGSNGRLSLSRADGRESVRIDAATGDVVLFNADCAEEFDVAEEVDPGTVMVLGADGSLVASHEPYDTRVAGVVSGAGSFAPALVLDRRDSGRRRAPVALMGKVYCWLDADAGTVRVGDLLTTAERPGHAMRVVDRVRAFGALVGKALAPLQSGQALVPVLIGMR